MRSHCTVSHFRVICPAFAEQCIAAMNIFKAARPVASQISRFAPSTIPRCVRAESTAASTYENIIISSPKPGVGLSMCSVAGRMFPALTL